MLQNNTPQPGNNLFPVFLKLEELSVLIVGGGNVGLEKLTAVISNSPVTRISLVAIAIKDEIKELAQSHKNISISERAFEANDLNGVDIVIIAVNDPEASMRIRNEAKQKGKLVNVADKPEMCDFYLSSIVKKGNLKIAISTNGKSPTIAKRIKEVINDSIPDEIEDLLNNMQAIRNNMDGDFAEKVRKLNELTQMLVAKEGNSENTSL
jgi:hypothetical protein